MGHRGHDPDAYANSPAESANPRDPIECPFCEKLVKDLPSHLVDCDLAE